MAISGYEYSFSIHMGLGRGPVDEVVEARVDDKLAWKGSATIANAVHNINAPYLFGGPEKEGGIQGFFHCLQGEDTQVPSTAVATIAPTPVGFRRMLTVFYNGVISALNPYPKAWSWRVRRAVNGWDGPCFRPDLAIIDLEGDAIAGSGTPKTGRAASGHSETHVVPFTHGAMTTLPAPYEGAVITKITRVSLVTGSGDTQTTTYLPFEGHPAANGGMDGIVNCVFFGESIGWEFDYTLGGFTHSGAMSQVVERYQASVRVTYPVPNNGTMTSVEDFFYQGSEAIFITGDEIPFTVVENIPGSFTLELAPLYFGQILHCGFIFNDATGTHQGSNDNTQILGIEHGSIVTLTDLVELSNGGELAIVTSCLTSHDNDYTGWPGDWSALFPPAARDLIYVSAPPSPDIEIKDPRIEGGKAYIGYYYYTNLDNSNLSSDRSIRAMNPAHIIYEALTNREWGRGLDRSLLATASFEAAATTLKAEGFGACGRWNRTDAINSFIQGILDYCGATLYSDRSTALLTLHLIRGDYDRNALKLWDTSNGLLAITDSTVNTSTMVINEVIVKYKDPVLNANRSINVQNLASLQSSGGCFNTRTTDYPFCPTGNLARRLAQRDLRGYAEGLRRFRITVDRRGRDLFPGQVIRIQDFARAIPDTVCRIATMKDGTVTDGKIELNVVQDVFSFPGSSYVGQQPDSWVPPNYTPCSPEQRAIEIPYFLLSRTMRPADLAYVTNGAAFMGSLVAQGQRTNTGYQIAIRTHAPTSDDQPTGADKIYCGFEP